MTRIIAGTLASRRLITPRGVATRPTTDRVRESVFGQLVSWLGADTDQPLAGRCFLDLFAGSGAMGLEAYSRGASVTWVEQDPAVVRVIEQNRRALGVGGTVAAMAVSRFLARQSVQCDIVWMDPPYDHPNDEITRLAGAILDRGWLKPGGRLLVERSGHTSAIEFPDGFCNPGERRYGDTVVYQVERRA